MAEAMRCMRCMQGIIVNGQCNHCGRTPERPEERRADALPVQCMLRGRYLIGDVLGQGGFGITYAAWDTAENRRVAIKELYPAQDVSRRRDGPTHAGEAGKEKFFAQVLRSFQNEARMLIELQQDGVVRLYHVFEENGTVYYAMEFLDGQDLSGLLKQCGTLTWQQLAPIIRVILSALKQLHSRGLIHRDISPDNIFLTRDGATRLIDFGSVRVYQGNRSFTTYIKQNFAPLEQYQTHGNQGPWTDVYSLCVTIYHALSGRLPAIAPERRMQDATVPIELLCPHLPPYVAEGIRKGMTVTVEGRCRSIDELSAYLFPGEAIAGAPSVPALCCDAGVMAGRSWQLRPGQQLSVGRGAGPDIVYPERTPGVSHAQCRFYADETGRILVRDEGSRYGTFCDGQKLNPGEWRLLQPGAALTFGHERYTIR